MSRQSDVKAEERETARRLEVIRALDFGLAGAIEFHGGELRGFSMKYNDFDCMLTLKASFEGKWFVSFVSSETMIGCILSTQRKAAHNAIEWTADKYQPVDS